MTKRGASMGVARFDSGRRDFVDTPIEPVVALVNALPPRLVFTEPCAGAGELVRHLERFGHVCLAAYDITPRSKSVDYGDATQRVPRSVVISNPPYSRRLAVPILSAAMEWPFESFWLVPLDWISNLWFAPFAAHVHRVIPVGRVSWVRNPDGSATGSGFENSAWIQLASEPVGFIEPRRKLEVRSLDLTSKSHGVTGQDERRRTSVPARGFVTRSDAVPDVFPRAEGAAPDARVEDATTGTASE